MNEESAKEISASTSKLRTLLSCCSMKSIAVSIALEFTKLLQEGAGAMDMHSPFRQLCHILGLALTSSEPSNDHPITEEEWSRAKRLSTTIFDVYADIYLPKPPGGKGSVYKPDGRTAVTMSTFLQFLSAPSLRSEDQFLDRIRALYVPFDGILLQSLGFSASDYIRLIEVVKARRQQRFEVAIASYQAAAEEHKRFVESWDIENEPLDETRAAANRHPVRASTDKMLSAFDQLHTLRIRDLEEELGAEIAERVLDRLGARRGLDPSEYQYATDMSPAVRHPLIFLDSDTLICVDHSLLLHSAEVHFEAELTEGKTAEKYFKLRDEWMEKRTAEALSEFLTGSGQVFRGVCETSDGQNEHDVVARVDGEWIVAEVKAAPLRRKFYDPEKAFPRIRDDFKSDRGIQKAYEQGEQMRQSLLSSARLRYYDRAGRVIIDEPGPADDATVICVTGETWGIVALDLSLLLEKASENPYPWGVSIDDFEAFLMAMKLRRKTPADFLRFLRQRSQLHSRVFSDDELNIDGYFIENGNLPSPTGVPEELLFFTPEHSQVFDEAFFQLHGTPIKRNREQEQDRVLTGIRDTLSKIGSAVGSDCCFDRVAGSGPSRRTHKVGRNEPCPCGSGLKYKRCCGA